MLVINQAIQNTPKIPPSENRWYVFYTYPPIEAVRLAGASINDLGYQTFIPWEKRRQRAALRRSRIYETPLFPRYGFVQFDIDRDDWGCIKYAKGVVDILRSNSIPQSVPQMVIDGLKLSENMGLFDKTKPPSIGMDVLVTYGPFHEFIGKVKRARYKDRVDVLLNFLGSERLVTVPVVNLKEI